METYSSIVSKLVFSSSWTVELHSWPRSDIKAGAEMRSQQSWLCEKCVWCKCAEWMNAGRDLSGLESHSVPVPLSPDGYRLYVKLTQPFCFGRLHRTEAELYNLERSSIATKWRWAFVAVAPRCYEQWHERGLSEEHVGPWRSEVGLRLKNGMALSQCLSEKGSRF